MDNQQITKSTHIDPTALGLFGLAMVTLVASSQKLGLTTGVSSVLPWAFFLGACAQLVAAVYDFKKGNVFGGTAFGAYGFFWLAICFNWLISLNVFGETAFSAADHRQTGFAFLGYLIFTFYMTIAATETNKVLLAIFILIDFLFIGLTMHSFEIGPESFSLKLAGLSELLIALLSFYGSAANILNQHFGRTFLPIGKPLGIFKK